MNTAFPTIRLIWRLADRVSQAAQAIIIQVRMAHPT